MVARGKRKTIIHLKLDVARILIIEDEPEIRNLLREMLESNGHWVDEAPNGAVGMQRWREHSRAQAIDLIITDILMPEKDGLEVIRAIQRLAPDTKIVVISGGSSRLQLPLLDIAARLGAFHTVEKPFTMRTLLAAVNDALDGKCEAAGGP